MQQLSEAIEAVLHAERALVGTADAARHREMQLEIKATLEEKVKKLIKSADSLLEQSEGLDETSDVLRGIRVSGVSQALLLSVCIDPLCSLLKELASLSLPVVTYLKYEARAHGGKNLGVCESAATPASEREVLCGNSATAGQLVYTIRLTVGSRSYPVWHPIPEVFSL